MFSGSIVSFDASSIYDSDPSMPQGSGWKGRRLTAFGYDL